MANRVVILGIDGAGGFIQNADAPHIHTLLKAGAYSYDAQTVYPSISAECWGSLLYGVKPDRHGLDNDRAIHGRIPEDFPYASLFKLARRQWPDAPLSAFSCWAPINTGIIENTINVHMESKPDPELAEAIVDYIHQQPDFKLMFIQLDHPDGAGHKHGFGTDLQLEQIAVTDQYVGMIVKALKDQQLLEDTWILTVTDHGGGGAHPNDHGSDHPMDMTITWGITGPGVKPGLIEAPIGIMDTTVVIGHVLGLPAQPCWEGKVPEGIL